jgi:predicted O-methyltransferase YrrM
MNFVEIDKKKYKVRNDEFKVLPHLLYNNLIILDDVGTNDRVVSLLKDLVEAHGIKQCIFTNPTHGGYVPINCTSAFEKMFVVGVSPDNTSSLYENFINNDIRNATWSLDSLQSSDVIMYLDNASNYIDLIQKLNTVLVAPTNSRLNNFYRHSFSLENTNLSVYIPDRRYTEFCNAFYYFLNGNVLKYDNLINLCIMVKNGGEQFEEMLNKNMHLIDRWTILDTGSTDGTLDIIKKVLIGKKKGKLFREPFINFRDSRNRLLQLAGKDCKFTLMLDDTYTIAGDLRGFLEEVRGDQFADSFSLYIKSDDVEYASNRVLKTYRQLKYKYKIHEVIQDENNMNVIIPIERTRIEDGRFEYMEERTMGRKELDLKLLYEELEDDPNNSRTHYYLGQTYNLLQQHEKAFQYFMERADHPTPGFLQEKIDAIFEGARLANFQLNKPWPLCEALYNRAYELDKSRPDSLYFLGIHYFLEGDKTRAFDYFKRAFEIGYPVHCQYSLKPTLSYHFLPKFLSQLCYENQDFVMGEQSARLFLEKNKPEADQYDVQMSWYKIFVNLNKMNAPNNIRATQTKPLLVFVADGGFEPWSGSDILKKGVGGSETYIIEMARYIQKQGAFKVVVFCNCIAPELFEDVDYIPLDGFHPFAKNVPIHSCIVSRFSEYIPVAIHGKVDNLYMVLHDLGPSGVVLPMHPKFKKVFCLSEWHVSHFLSIFPQFNGITVPFYYGIDVDKFKSAKSLNGASLSNASLSNGNIRLDIVEPKVNNKFIYSSFPNRGLLQLLQMWPKIVGQYPDASLHIYSDVDGKWVNSVEKEMMIQVRQLLNYYKGNKANNIVYHGWVNKAELADGWNSAEYWFYPCTFKETFCLTAVEAALSRTACITNGLAALENTVGDRGICVPGDPSTKEWQQRALDALFAIMENKVKREQLIEKNFNWASNMSWSNQAKKLVDQHLQPYPPLGKVEPNPPLGKVEPKSPFQSHGFQQNQSFQQPPSFQQSRALEQGFQQPPSFQQPPAFQSQKKFDAELRDNVSNTMKNLNIDNYPTYVPPPKQTQVAPSPIPFANLSSAHLAQPFSKVDLAPPKVDSIRQAYPPSLLAPPLPKVDKVDSLIPPITHPGYVPKNNGLETGGMLNWTDDLPMGQGAKATFEKVLKHFVDFNKKEEPRVLEVGVFAGTSLIEIVKRIPNSKATAIDRWDSYEEINVDKMQNREILQNNEFVKALDCLSTINERKIEDIFHQNVAVAGMRNRIRTLKGDSHAVLMDLVNQKAKFDFIYVDGSHKCLDVALDLFLSWQLLEKGGIMAIDDYLYTLEKDYDVNPLEYPYNAVNHFLDKYKKELIVLEKGYRAFIKKIHL